MHAHYSFNFFSQHTVHHHKKRKKAGTYFSLSRDTPDEQVFSSFFFRSKHVMFTRSNIYFSWFCGLFLFFSLRSLINVYDTRKPDQSASYFFIHSFHLLDYFIQKLLFFFIWKKTRVKKERFFYVASVRPTAIIMLNISSYLRILFWCVLDLIIVESRHHSRLLDYIITRDLDFYNIFSGSYLCKSEMNWWVLDFFHKKFENSLTDMNVIAWQFF